MRHCGRGPGGRPTGRPGGLDAHRVAGAGPGRRTSPGCGAPGRADARAKAWAGGAGPDLQGELRIDFDATITIAHSEKENAAATWKKTFGFHPLLAFLDRPDIAAGEGLAGLLRRGNAGSNTAADHITVLDMALASLPKAARPRPGDPDSVRVVARSDSAGATHAFAAACRDRGEIGRASCRERVCLAV